MANNQLTAINVQVTDPDGEVEGGGLTYRVSGGADQNLFTIDPNTGVLSFKTAPSFASPGDADKNNVYLVDVSVKDGGGISVAQSISVTVTNLVGVKDEDVGGAPSRYPVTLANNGARHVMGTLFLGSTVDNEIDGAPSNDAAADGGDDGVFVLATIIRGTVPTTSSFSVNASGPGKLDGWIDFNNDGDWLDAGEQIFTSTNVVAGSNLLSFTVPANATASSTAARFRLSTAGALAPTGPAVDCEVEDYIAAIIAGSSTALLNIDVPSGDTSVVVEGDILVVRKGTAVISKVPFANFGSLNLGGSSLNDILRLTILEALASKTLTFDGGAGKGFLALVESGRTLDLTDAKVTLRDIEWIDITGAGNNRLVISVEKVKAASSTTDTLEVVANTGDTIAFGTGFKIETPKFINGVFTHIISESTPGGTARVEIRNDRPLTNPLTPFDADRDGKILPLDALRIINEIRRRGVCAFPLPTNDSEVNKLYFDVSGDNRLTTLDALRIINAIARINRGGSPEGEAVATSVDPKQLISRPLAQREATDTAIQAIWETKVPRTSAATAVTPTTISAIDDVMTEHGTVDESDDIGGLELLSMRG